MTRANRTAVRIETRSAVLVLPYFLRDREDDRPCHRLIHHVACCGCKNLAAASTNVSTTMSLVRERRDRPVCAVMETMPMTMLTCRETSRLLSEGADRYLSPRERLAVRLHLLMCAPCRRFAKQLRWLRESVNRRVRGNNDDVNVGYADLPPALQARIAATADCGVTTPRCKKHPPRDD